MESRKNQITHKRTENENVGSDFSYGLEERERNNEAIERFVVSCRSEPKEVSERERKKKKKRQKNIKFFTTCHFIISSHILTIFIIKMQLPFYPK